MVVGDWVMVVDAFKKIEEEDGMIDSLGWGLSYDFWFLLGAEIEVSDGAETGSTFPVAPQTPPL
ncbi:uncharacterized protein N7515_006307 [Penicillium bovifimosum]|uniref:Uncharacterized protein n=1 Tax=Penicillium bovifimosum TaxID=126998 RepID=A0A9W9GUT5_9EURO|nr:uncharacterized protein N7515_006307 [Penicillium bovifimosum]KAJ5130268.1 hypothetical protein N7515_006307 [Penicillium bovifimosum]